VTYTSLLGLPVTCLVASRQVFDPRVSDVAYAQLDVDGPDGCATKSDVSIHVTYLLPGRTPASGTVSGRGSVTGTWGPVADDFRTRHSVHFDNCDPDAHHCDFDVTLVQPK
jgi:hypothetical protein